MHILGFELLRFITDTPDEAQRNETELLELFAQGKVVPHVCATFPLESAATALRLVADCQAIGQVVVAIRS